MAKRRLLLVVNWQFAGRQHRSLDRHDNHLRLYHRARTAGFQPGWSCCNYYAMERFATEEQLMQRQTIRIWRHRPNMYVTQQAAWSTLFSPERPALDAR